MVALHETGISKCFTHHTIIKEMLVDSKTIYIKLLQKCPNTRRNKHYLKRYVRFIVACIDNNKSLSADTYTENHHILPRGKTFWPEYASFRKYPWNKATLTPEQHFLCHLMLARSLGGYMWFAFNMLSMRNGYQDKRTKMSSRFYGEIKRNVVINLREKAKGKKKTPEEIEKWKASRKGYEHSPSTKQKMKDTHKRKNFYTSTITLYQGIYKIEVLKYSDKLYQYIGEGWSKRVTKEYLKEKSKDRVYKRTRLVKAYKGQFYCWVVNESDDYYDCLENGCSSTMTEEYKTRLKNEKSNKMKGISRPRKVRAPTRWCYTIDGKRTKVNVGKLPPEGVYENSPLSKHLYWHVDLENRLAIRCSSFEAEVNGYVKIESPNKGRVKYVTDKGENLYLSDLWKEDWVPVNLTRYSENAENKLAVQD